MSELPEKCCRRCHWFENKRTYPDADGIIYHGRFYGNCAHPVPFVVFDMDPELHEQKTTWPLLDSDGTDCPCFEPKEKTK